MSISTSIDDLMLRWEEARADGRSLTLSQLCADAPNLAEELGKRIRAVTAMEAVLGVSVHGSQKTMSDPDAGHAPAPAIETPRIPGYEIIRVIDQGGMGIVYEARQVELGRIVAIKMISGHIRPTALVRFRAEAEVAARLQHPNFVQIFEVGQVNGKPFFSMEFVAGGSLAASLAKGKPDPRAAAELVETLARAVHAAHQREIVHRDLKPSNVMLADGGIPKIADFGLAKRLDDDSGHTHSGEILGTPSYMAPEQAEGRKAEIGPHTDVYALGAIFYEMLTGRPPFQDPSPLQALRRVASEEPTAPTQLAPLPRDLEAICLKCLEKSPSKRYLSALELADDLRRFLNGLPVTARHIGHAQRLWRWVCRHPQGIGLGTTLSILVLLPLGYLAAQLHSQQQVRAKAIEQAPLVREILQRNCYECHGQDVKTTQKNLDILKHDQLVDGRRRIVVPGAPENSRLIQRIKDGSMPPEKEEVRLPRVSEMELEILNDWILGGAPPFPTTDGSSSVSAVPNSKLAAQTKAIFHKR